MSERIDRRVLGAVQAVDVAGRRPIARELHVVSETLRFTRNQSGLHVVTNAPGFEAYTGVFDQSVLPVVPPREFFVRVEDPAGEFHPREIPITLPRDTTPVARGVPPPTGSLFAVEEIELLPTILASVASSDAVLFVRALRAPNGPAFAGLLVRANGPGGIVGWGMTDADGEALVAVPGLPHFRETGGTLTDRTTLTLAFIAMAPPPAGRLPNWRDSAMTPGNSATLAGGQPPSVDAAPGREFRLTAIVTP